MTEKAYRDAIEKATKSLGVYRIEFTRTRVRLAKIYCRIERLQKALEAGDFDVIIYDDDKPKLDPRMAELDRLNDQALTYEKSLGLTADGCKKLRDDMFAKERKPDDPLSAALADLSGGRLKALKTG